MTTQELSNIIFVSLESMQKAALRKGWGEFHANSELSQEQIIQALTHFKEPHHTRSEESTQAARNLYDSLNFKERQEASKETVQQILEAKDKTPQPTVSDAQAKGKRQQSIADKPKAKAVELQPTKLIQFLSWLTANIGDKFLMIVFLAAMGFQMHHSAHIVAIVEHVGEFKEFWGWVFAIATQFTALLLTIRNGEIFWLRGFFFLELFINMLYYAPWDIPEVSFTIVSIHSVASLTIAFTIYSYAELFSKKQLKQKANETDNQAIANLGTGLRPEQIAVLEQA